MNLKLTKKLFSNQQGVASILVAVVLMLVMSLIVLAMSQNAQREQRQSLDRQLSDQAFYNAESGINDAAAYLYQNPGAGIDKTDCSTQLPGIDNKIDGAAGVNKYTCLLYDKAPKSVQFDNISTSAPKVVPIQAVNDAGASVNISTLTVSWDDTANRNGDINGSCSFNSGAPTLPNSCNYGGLRFEIISPSENRDLIRQRAFISFLLPHANAGNNISVATSNYPNNQGIISGTNCSGGVGVRRCSKTITDIGRNNLYVNLRSLYRPVNVSISGTDTDGSAIRFKDAQIMIDATGKANDVLRRVQVRIPANSQFDYPGFALQSKDSICKVLEVRKNNDGSGAVSSTDSSACPIN